MALFGHNVNVLFIKPVGCNYVLYALFLNLGFDIAVTSKFDQLRAVRSQDVINRAIPRRKIWKPTTKAHNRFH